MSSRPGLPRVLGPLQALGVVVGGTIGASIFLVPAVVAQRVPFLSGALLVWILGAAIGLAGVLTIAELAAMLPEAGGGYVYIRTALGPFFGFLFAWTDAVMIRAGAAATISFTFGIYFSQVVPAPAGIPAPAWQGCAAIVLLACLTALNVRGARIGADVQVGGTILKTLALGSALVLPLLLWRGPNALGSALFWPPLGASAATGLVAAMIPVMWTYAGSEQLAHLAEEMRDPGRDFPRVLAAGLLIIGLLYLAVAIGIHYVLPFSAVAASPAVGADLFRALFGPAGITAISVLILLSTVITANGAVLSGPRSAFAVARDGYAPAWLARVNSRFKTPANAVLALGCWSAALIVISVGLMLSPPPPGLRTAWTAVQRRPLFDVLISYVMFGYLLLQTLVAISLFVLRRKRPDMPRPFRVPAYPWTPSASIAATFFLMAAMAWSSPLEAMAGILIMLAGLPVWRFYSRYHR